MRNVVLAMAVLTAACGTGGDGVVVRMLDNSYDPVEVVVTTGTPVTFVNDGRVEHNVVAVDGSFDSRTDSGNQQPGDEWTLVPSTAGTFDYYCTIHAIQDDQGAWNGMVGTLIVEGS